MPIAARLLQWRASHQPLANELVRTNPVPVYWQGLVIRLVWLHCAASSDDGRNTIRDRAMKRQRERPFKSRKTRNRALAARNQQNFRSPTLGVALPMSSQHRVFRMFGRAL